MKTPTILPRDYKIRARGQAITENLAAEIIIRCDKYGMFFCGEDIQLTEELNNIFDIESTHEKNPFKQVEIAREKWAQLSLSCLFTNRLTAKPSGFMRWDGQWSAIDESNYGNTSLDELVNDCQAIAATFPTLNGIIEIINPEKQETILQIRIADGEGKIITEEELPSISEENFGCSNKEEERKSLEQINYHARRLTGARSATESG